MVMQLEMKSGITVFKEYVQYFKQLFGSPYVNGRFTPHQVHREQQPGKSQDMVAMHMAYEHLVDPRFFYFITLQLHLGAFAAIYQYMMIEYVQVLGRRMPVMGGRC
jgi:hypothetical protein